MHKNLLLSILLLPCGAYAQDPAPEDIQPEQASDQIFSQTHDTLDNDEMYYRALELEITKQNPHRGGSLSQENEAYIRALFKEIGIDHENISISQPSPSFITHNPASAYKAVFRPEYLTFYVNEEWLNKLTESEKRFFIGKHSIELKNRIAYFEREKRQFLIKLGLGACKVTSIVLLYRYLGRKFERFTTKYAQQSLSTWSWRVFQKLCISAIPTVLFELLIEYPLAQRHDTKVLCDEAKQTVETLNCLDGALAFYKRLREELAPHVKAGNWYYYDCQDIDKLIPYLESLKEQKA